MLTGGFGVRLGSDLVDERMLEMTSMEAHAGISSDYHE